MLTPFTRKTLTRVSFLVWLLISALILPFSALAGQTIVIDKHVTHDVHGNGDLPNGDVSSLPASLLDPNNNTVQVLPGGQVDTSIIGGYSDSVYGTATATNNSVSMSGGQVGGGIIGGYSHSLYGTATAKNNSVSMSGGQVEMGISGGSSHSEYATATTTGNRVTMSGGQVVLSAIIGGDSVSISGTATANNNSVSMSGGQVDNSVVGGRSVSPTGTAITTGNSVTLSGGQVDGLYYDIDGNMMDLGVAGGVSISVSGTATTTGNSVIMSGGRVIQNVYGGYSYSTSGTATATGNRVIITGGQVDGNVYGGYSETHSGTGTSATGNSVTLMGTPAFGATSALFGGFAGNANGILTANMDGFTGNTLNVWNYHGSAVDSVQSFEYYNFAMPSNAGNGDTLFTVTGTAYMSDRNSLGKSASVSGVNIMGGGTPLQVGDRITLLKATTLSGTLANDGAHLQGRKGVSLIYDDISVHQDLGQNELFAQINSGPRLNPQTKALSAGRVAGVVFVNQGADLVAGKGMNAARNSRSGLTAFTAFQGGRSRYNSGSHVDVDGFSLMGGVAWNGATEYGNLLLGAFFEAGWGDYDSHNSFSNAASVRGDGDTNYYGGGILGRFDFTNNLYTEASFRVGQVDTDFGSSDLRDPIGNRASYDSSSTYYGAHLGLGYIWNITDATSLDISTKYLWTHQDSDRVTVVGDPVKFKASNSQRWRTGARLSHSVSTESGLTFTPYIGAAYEHEFDGKAKATTYGYSIDAPDLKGGTGMGELGLSFKPVADSGLSLDLGAQGYTGVREGVSGSFQAKWEF